MANLNEGIVQDWLDRYLEAWRTYDEDLIRDLFTEDATYRHYPDDEPLVGRDEIVDDWLSSPDPAGSWTAEYTPWVVAEDRAVATGWTHYREGERYFNMFQLVFSNGHVSEFTEWWMKPRENV